VGSKGGVIRFPLAQMTLQLFVHSDRFPEGFGNQSRSYSMKNYSQALKLVKKAEKDINKKSWIEISGEDKKRYEQMFQEVRLRLRDKHKVYHKTALTLMRKVRCKKEGARAECAEKKE
jgi:basic membrane lipoprotein Med (substrate-binding protein (PBP1-ABC) superfamily)